MCYLVGRGEGLLDRAASHLRAQEWSKPGQLKVGQKQAGTSMAREEELFSAACSHALQHQLCRLTLKEMWTLGGKDDALFEEFLGLFQLRQLKVSTPIWWDSP